MDTKDGGPAFLNGWRRSEQWKRHGKHCLVEVSRHRNDWIERDEYEHHWCVYLYVYPDHPDFERFNADRGMWEQPSYTCHSYVSLFRVHRNNQGEVTAYQLGWDYAHDGDSDYSTYATPSDASSVFYDAARLLDECEARAKVSP